MIRHAVTCDRERCLALYLESEEPVKARFEDAIAEAGWTLRPAAVALPGYPAAPDVLAHLCPACAAGRGPVLERGDCPTCSGATENLEAGATCHYCRKVVPHLADKWC
ncbi:MULTISPECIES: hypothetical protein [unclassified Streptomyces]|uniref:hypothetical protein n=1 Tax=unclassified Streptomyces TaxID=2593676 RepID=UPI002E323F42|nr:MULTISPECIES: hypothetical protein [unclassified Streptomyces]WUC68150.1 hypothetical protein OG861_30075 [Streptomyces sp. NBC_00539]